MKPQFVTFTGLDDKTDLADAFLLSLRYPVEWGVLFGGRLGANRYPSQPTIEKIVNIAEKIGVEISAHLCGVYARQAVYQNVVPDIVKHFNRTQINAIKYDIEALSKLHQSLNIPVIMQHRHGPFPVLPDGIFSLHDQSGGKGVVPKNRPLQIAEENPKLVGYAGGLGPENVAEVLEGLEGHFWIDMESKIRTDDWLDLEKCEAVCKAIWGDKGR